MTNKKCPVCIKVKGKRICQLNNNALICPLCCAQARCSDCEGCHYYAQSEQYAQMKQSAKLKHFLRAINPEVDDKLDDALVMVENGNVQAGEEIISELLKANPELATTHYAMGVVYIAKKQYDESLACFEKAADIFPEFIEAWFNKGTCHQLKMDIEEAIKAFQKVVELGNLKDEFVRHAKNVVTDFEKTVYEEAGISLEVYFGAKDKFEAAHTCMKNEEYEEAVTGFQAVISINPKLPQAYANLGICYAQLDNKSEALKAFEQALALEPEYEPAIFNRDIVASLKEGETFSDKIASLEYYKD